MIKLQGFKKSLHAFQREKVHYYICGYHIYSIFLINIRDMRAYITKKCSYGTFYGTFVKYSYVSKVIWEKVADCI